MTFGLSAVAAGLVGAVFGRWRVLWLPPLVVAAWAAGVKWASWPSDSPVAFAALVAEVGLTAGVLWRRRQRTAAA